jgi:hypothetical protein
MHQWRLDSARLNHARVDLRQRRRGLGRPVHGRHREACAFEGPRRRPLGLEDGHHVLRAVALEVRKGLVVVLLCGACGSSARAG